MALKKPSQSRRTVSRVEIHDWVRKCRSQDSVGPLIKKIA